MIVYLVFQKRCSEYLIFSSRKPHTNVPLVTWTRIFVYEPDVANAKGNPFMFDPAAYYGLREADIAMTELFGRLPQRFYDAYNEAFPMNPGYLERRDLHNLYHLLNHLNLFGGSYLSSVQQVINRYIN